MYNIIYEMSHQSRFLHVFKLVEEKHLKPFLKIQIPGSITKCTESEEETWYLFFFFFFLYVSFNIF